MAIYRIIYYGSQPVHAVVEVSGVFTEADALNRADEALRARKLDWQDSGSIDYMDVTSDGAELVADETYRCTCSWVGSDPDFFEDEPTCPACWKHDHKRVVVKAEN